MLEYIDLENFQAHIGLKIVFDPRITTIVGPTDAGKSSIIRALGWVTLGGPVAVPANYGTKVARVAIGVDGHTVIRQWGEDKNLYQLDDTEFKAFRGVVPGELAQLLCMSEVNFQRQLDQPYWLSATPGEVARQLNRIINLDIIDRVLGGANTVCRQATAEVEAARKVSVSLAQAYRAGSWVRCATAGYTQLSAMDARAAVASARASRYRAAVAGAHVARAGHEDAVGASSGYGTVLRLAGSAVVASERAEKLRVCMVRAGRLLEVVSGGKPDIGPLGRVAAANVAAARNVTKLRSWVDVAREASRFVSAGKPDIVGLGAVVGKATELLVRVRALRAALGNATAARGVATGGTPDMLPLETMANILAAAGVCIGNLRSAIKKARTCEQELQPLQVKKRELDVKIGSVETCPTCHRPL